VPRTPQLNERRLPLVVEGVARDNRIPPRATPEGEVARLKAKWRDP
jgi:hypothetical protein